MGLISIMNYTEGLEQLAYFANQRNLIPIFGAGFTCGCQACEGIVPNTPIAKLDIKKLILKSTSLFESQELDMFDFYGISEIFFEHVSSEERTSYFEKNYTGVSLFENQSKFLDEINWPYAYTLNVDDGIEENSSFTAVLPYHELRRPKTSKKLLYKLHGDASYECKYKNQNNIVFSQSQYLQSITDSRNVDIYDALLSDFCQKHLLFIGCSLQSETDIQYIYNTSIPLAHETFRIIIRNTTPNIIEQQNLKKHGVNEIIIVPDYEMFYVDLLSKYQEIQKIDRKNIYEFINPEIITIASKDESIRYLSGINIFDSSINTFYKGKMHILRNVVNEISNNLSKYPCVLIKGRRFSGKTFLLCSLAERYRKKDVFYFPSTSFADELVVEILFSEIKNGIFIFDSNSISPDVYGMILRYIDYIEQQHNYIIIAANSNDNYLLSKAKCYFVELKNSFEEVELVQNSKAADSFALSRRKKGHTNIDYLITLNNNQNVKIPFLTNRQISYTSLEKSILIALCALDKLYFSDLITLSAVLNSVQPLIDKTTPLIEMIPTGRNESTHHSTSKLVHNSKYALIELLKQFNDDDIVESIFYIVKRFKPNYSRRRLYIEIILFDTLNQIFSGRVKSEELFANIYEKLQPVLENDLHYWLQRAKCIYRTFDSIEKLDEAYSYSKKVYIDSEYNEMAAKAALTTSLIACALGEKREENKLGDYEEAVILAHEAVFSDFYRVNPRYLENDLPIGKNTYSERRITTACNYVIEHSKTKSFIDKGKNILQRFENHK